MKSLAAEPTPAPNFGLLARPYRWLEYGSFGPFLWHCRTHFLTQLAGCGNALVLGEGDGRFTARLLRDNPEIRITAVDVSPEMIAALEKAAGNRQDRLSTQVTDVRSWTSPALEYYDLIVTHFFLDCLIQEEIAALADRLRPSLAPNALWLVSEFAIPSTRFGRFVATPLVSLLYCAFRLVTRLRVASLPDYSAALKAAGWSLSAQRSQLRGLLVSQLWRLDEAPR